MSNPFSFDTINDTLNQAIRALPEDAKGGLFVDGTKQADGKTAATLIVVTKIGSHVSIATGGSWDGSHIEGKVAGRILW